MNGFWTESRKIAYRVLGILAFVQIGFGGVWAVRNLGTVPYFSRTQELLEISETLVTDQYVGILYPLLIRILKMVESLIPVPYHYYLYLAQLGMGYYAVKKLLNCFKCPFSGIVTLWIMTIPVVMQMYLAVLPQAFAVSALLLCLVYCHQRQWIGGGVSWLIGGLFIPEYLWFGGLVFCLNLAAAAIRRKGAATGKKEGAIRRKKAAKGVLCALIVCVAACAVNAVSREDYSRGRMIRTPASVMLQRMVWPHYATTSSFWGYEVLELFDEEALRELAQDPELPVREFGPVIEKTYGFEKAQDIYKNMAESVFRVRTREVAGDMANDLFGYSLPLPALLWYLEGNGVSYSGWNYGQMCEVTPVLTKYYVQITGKVFCLLMIIGLGSIAVSLGATLRRRIGTAKRADAKRADAKCAASKSTTSGTNAKCIPGLLWLTCFLLCSLQILWYTFSSSGTQDYKNAMLVSICWGVWLAHRILGFFSSAREITAPIKGTEANEAEADRAVVNSAESDSVNTSLPQ